MFSTNIHNHLKLTRTQIMKNQSYLKFNLTRLLVKLLLFTSRKNNLWAIHYWSERNSDSLTLSKLFISYCFLLRPAHTPFATHERAHGICFVISVDAKRQDAGRQSKTGMLFPMIAVLASCCRYSMPLIWGVISAKIMFQIVLCGISNFSYWRSNSFLKTLER